MFVLNSIRKRPVLFSVLLILMTDMLLMLWITDKHSINEPFRSQGVVIGRVVNKEEMNGQICLYVKDLRFEAGDSKVPGIADRFLERMGCVVYMKENDDAPAIGKSVALKGDISVYSKSTNPGEFDMQEYMMSKGYLYVCKDATLVSEMGKANVFKELLYKFRSRCISLLEEALPQKDAGIMKAVLLADKNDLDKETKEQYSKAGVGHILAISGMHISLIATAFLWFFNKLKIPMNISSSLTVLLLIVYGVMIGFPPSAIRAIVMFAVMSLAKTVKGSYDMLTSMAIALLVTVVVKPLCVIQSGFIMSYLAIVGMAVVSPAVMPYHPTKRKKWTAISGSIAVSLTTLPVIMNSYYRVPVWSVIINLIIVPSMSALVGMGVLCIVFESLHLGIPNIFAVGVSFILSVYEVLVQFETSLPFANIVTGRRPIWRGVLYLLILVILSSVIQYYKCKFFKRQKLIMNLQRSKPEFNTQNILKNEIRHKRKALCVAWLAMTLNVIALFVNVKQNKIEFVNVGQGLFVCVQYNGHVIAFDGGSTDRSDIYEYVMKNYFLFYGIDEVDAWFVSHMDNDHISGIKELLADDEIKVKTLFFPQQISEETGEFTKLCLGKTDIGFLNPGDVISGKDIWMKVLSPYSDEVYEDANGASLVMYMKVEDEVILLTGDAGTAAEKYIILEGIHPTVYQVAHHGSAVNCNSADFINSLMPGISVISCGYHNSYGHPHAETLERLENIGSTVLRTDYDGCITIPIK